MAVLTALTSLLPLAITQSVGMKGKNLPHDVIRVQEVFNAIPPSEGTPEKLLTYDGIAGPKTCGAIQQFQLKHFGWKGADGRIDPGGRTAQLLSGLLIRYGSAVWNIRRIESATPADGNVNVVRTAASADRFFALIDHTGTRRALYYFLPTTEPFPAHASEVPPLRERPEFSMFGTASLCGPFAFVGNGMYSEYSPDENHAVIQIQVTPVAAHVAPGPFTWHIHHQWLQPMSTPGARIWFPGTLSFVRDDSAVGRKTPRF